MIEPERFTIHLVCQKHIRHEGVLKEQRRPMSIRPPKHCPGRLTVRLRTRQEELLVGVAESISAPPNPAATPRGHAVKVRDLLHPRE